MHPRTGTSKPQIDTHRGTVRQQIAATLSSSSSAIDSEWSYSRDAPWSVQVAFPSGGVAVRWVFARELLVAGVDGWAGLGDVRLGPAPRRDRGPRITMLHVGGQGRVVPVSLDTQALESFVHATTQIVPFGAESRQQDWDAALEGWLAGD